MLMFLSFTLLLLCAAAIYLSCEYFVNAVEWAGKQLHLGQTATGTVLAAFGTALPESAVTFMAVVWGKNDAQRDLGMGAALAGPLVLATISYAVVGAVLLASRRRLGRDTMAVLTDQRRLSQDQLWFLILFAFKLALGLVVFTFKPWCGVLFLLAYAAYVYKEIHCPREDIEDAMEPLRLCPSSQNPPFYWVLAQSFGALLVMGVASHYFVASMQQVGEALQVAPALVALLLSPIATELPETLNAVIWVRQGKEKLALANISGAMMVQATVPTAIGLFYTPWVFSPPLMLAAGITLAAVALLFAMFRCSRVNAYVLVSVSSFYALFAGLLWRMF